MADDGSKDPLDSELSKALNAELRREEEKHRIRTESETG